MVKAIKKSSSSAAATAEVVEVADVPPLRSAEKGSKLRSVEKKKKEKKRTETPEDDLCIHIYEHFSQKNVILPEGSKTLFARDIACPRGRKITQADFKKFFKRTVGKVVNVQIKFYANEKIVELAEIEFESHDVAKEALKKMNNRELFGTLVCLDVSREGSGFAYIVFKDFESLPKAVGLDGTEFMGAPMKIRRAKVYVTSW